MRAGSRAALAALGLAALLTPSLGAQAPAAGSQRIGENAWTVGAAVGAFAPRSAAIVTDGGRDTRLGAGPAFSLDLQYAVNPSASVYASGTTAFSTMALGSSIRPSVTGPSEAVTVLGGTAGLLLIAPTKGWLGEHFQPTLRLGGGLKGYLFDLTGAESSWRPTGDIGIGFRGHGGGPLSVHAEVRYLPSSFDQGKLPIRSITPQAQRQTDLFFSIGVSVRP
jgi:hypothetical protein